MALLVYITICSGMDKQAIRMNGIRLYSTCKASRVNVEESHKWKHLVCSVNLTADGLLTFLVLLDSREVSNSHDFMKQLSDDALEDDEEKSDSDTFVKSIFR